MHGNFTDEEVAMICVTHAREEIRWLRSNDFSIDRVDVVREIVLECRLSCAEFLEKTTLQCFFRCLAELDFLTETAAECSRRPVAVFAELETVSIVTAYDSPNSHVYVIDERAVAPFDPNLAVLYELDEVVNGLAFVVVAPISIVDIVHVEPFDDPRFGRLSEPVRQDERQSSYAWRV